MVNKEKIVSAAALLAIALFVIAVAVLFNPSMTGFAAVSLSDISPYQDNVELTFAEPGERTIYLDMQNYAYSAASFRVASSTSYKVDVFNDGEYDNIEGSDIVTFTDKLNSYISNCGTYPCPVPVTVIADSNAVVVLGEFIIEYNNNSDAESVVDEQAQDAAPEQTPEQIPEDVQDETSDSTPEIPQEEIVSEQIPAEQIEEEAEENYYVWEKKIKVNYAGDVKEFSAKLSVPESLKTVVEQLQLQEQQQATSKPGPAEEPLGTQEATSAEDLKQTISTELNDVYPVVEITPDSGAVKSIIFNDLKVVNDEISLGIADVARPDGLQSYALDPSQLEFSDAIVTAVAEGASLFKCKEWNFADKSCAGNWIELMRLSPGERYNFTLTKDDPGFVEGPEVNLTIWDDTDVDYQAGGNRRQIGEDARFFANYTNKADFLGPIVTGATCNIWFSDTLVWNPMDYNASGFYQYNRSFAAEQAYSWNVSCNKTLHTTLNINDSITIYNTSLTLECFNGIDWKQCMTFSYGEQIQKMRINCEAAFPAQVLNATYALTNSLDGTLISRKFDYLEGEYYVLNSNYGNKESGELRLNATCVKTDLTTQSYYENWTYAFGRLESYLVSPTTNSSFTRYKLFNITTKVRCVGGECIDVRALLDPKGQDNPVNPEPPSIQDWTNQAQYMYVFICDDSSTCIWAARQIGWNSAQWTDSFTQYVGTASSPDTTACTLEGDKYGRTMVYCRLVNSGEFGTDDFSYEAGGTFLYNVNWDTDSADCTCFRGADRWSIGGEISAASCCTDDAGENRIVETTGTDSPAPYNNNGAGSTCCDTSTDCSETGTDVCTATTVPAGTIPGRSYCNAGTWQGGDAGQTQCDSITFGSGNWSIGGEVAAAACCGDDSSENRIAEVSGADAPAGYNDGTTSCCSDATDCAYTNGGDTDLCRASGEVTSVGVPNRAYCSSGTWLGGDTSQAACDAMLNPGYWAIGGETAATNCCGDDASEVRTNSTIYQGGILFCCSNINQCAWNNESGIGYCTLQSSSGGIEGDGGKNGTCVDQVDNDCDTYVDKADKNCDSVSNPGGNSTSPVGPSQPAMACGYVQGTKGRIPTQAEWNSTMPFYTVNENPKNSTQESCLADLKGGEECQVSWLVNGTGEVGSNWEFFVLFYTEAASTTGCNTNQSSSVYLKIASNNSPQMTLNSPVNLEHVNSNFTFNCSATDDMGLKNISLWTNLTGTWAQTGSTLLLSGTSGRGNWTVYNVQPGAYKWNCIVYDTDSNFDWNNEDYIFTRNIAPQFNMVSLGTFHILEDNINDTIDLRDFVKDTEENLSQYKWYCRSNNTNVSVLANNNTHSLMINASFNFTSDPGYVHSDGEVNITCEAFDPRDGYAIDSFLVHVDNVNDFPVVIPGGPYNQTVNRTIVLNGSNSYDIDNVSVNQLQFTWTFGDGSPQYTSALGEPNVTHNYTEIGTYNAQLAISDGLLTSSIRFTVTITPDNTIFNDPPVANAGGPYESQAMDNVTLNGSQTIDIDNTTNQLLFTWTFGDGTPQQSGYGLVELQHNYTEAGSYTIELSVFDGNSTSTHSTSITVKARNTAVNDPPTADADGPYSALTDEFVIFDGSATNDPDNSTGQLLFTWTFGDGSSQVSGLGMTHPQHNYTEAGSYTVQLTVNDGNSTSSDSSSVTITNRNTAANDPSTANAGGPYTGVANEIVTLDGSGTTDPDNTTDQLLFTWNFGDGSVQESGYGLISPQHNYTESGSYTITLTIFDGNSTVTHTTTITITNRNTVANDPPTANAGDDYSSVVNETATLDGSGTTDPDNTTAQLLFTWTFGDGSPQQAGYGLINPQHNYTESGSYTIELSVFDGNSTSTDSATITVTNRNTASNDPPTVSAGGPYTSAAGDIVTLDGSATTDPDNTTSQLLFTWTFGDGAPQESGYGLTSPQHNYTEIGSYTIQLTIFDGNSTVSASTTITVTNRNNPGINDPPTANAGGPYSSVVNENATLDGSQTTDPDNTTAQLLFTWTFGDGSPQQSGYGLVNPQHNYTESGLYNIQLSVFDGNSTSTHSVEITVTNRDTGANDPSTANAGGPYTGVVNETITFDGSGTTDPDNTTDQLLFTWNYGDGTSQDSGYGLTNPQHNYTEAGSYTITLTIFDGNSTVTHTTTITITNRNTASNDPPTANSGGPYNSVVNEIVTLDGSGTTDPDNTTGQLLFTWTFGDGTPQQSGYGLTAPQHNYTESGSYTIELSVFDGNSTSTHSTTITVTNRNTAVNDPPTANAGGDYNSVVNDIATLDGSQTTDPDNTTVQLWFTWTFGDGSSQQSGYGLISPQHNYTESGSYTVQLAVFDGNSTSTDSATITVTNRDDSGVNDPSTANAGGPYTGVVNEIVTLDGSGTTDPDNTTDQLLFTWTFGDGTPQQSGYGLISPQHNYTEAGSYTIELTIFDGNTTTTHSTTITITNRDNPGVNDPPTANAGGPYNSVANEIVTLDGSQTTDPDNTTDQLLFTWTFGDGSSQQSGYGLISPQHNYTSSGTYTVQLSVFDGNSTSTDSTTVTVTNRNTASNDPPTANAGGPYSSVVNETVTLDGSATTDPDNTTDQLLFTWTFGDGTPQQSGYGLTAPQHNYTESGSYTIQLRVFDGSSTSTHSTTITITNRNNAGVNDPPTANAGGAYSSVVNEIATLDGSETTDPDNTTSQLLFTWTFGDGTPQQSGYGLINPQHNYTESGAYTIQLSVFDGNSTSTDSTTITVTNTNNAGVNDPPTASADGPYNILVNEIVTLDGSGTTDPDNATGQLLFTWTFGDGTPQQSGYGLTAPQHNYTESGSYTVQLAVFDGNSTSTDSTTVTVTNRNNAGVNDPPTANAGGPYNSVVNDIITLDGSGTTDPDNATEQLLFTWTFGDGTPQQSGYGLINPQHNYTESGSYTIQLSVFDGNSTSTDSATITVTNQDNAGVNDPPTANAGGPYSGVVDEIVTLDGSQTSDPDNTTSQLLFTWTFGDGSPQQSGYGLINPQHNYTTAGSYTVQLTVFDGNSTDTHSTTATISNRNTGANDAPVAEAGDPSGTPYGGKVGEIVTYDGSRSTDPDNTTDQLFFIWTFGDGTPQVSGYGLINPQHSYTGSGRYTVQLTVSDGENQDSDTQDVTITEIDNPGVNDPPTANAGGPYSSVENEIVTLDGSLTADPDNTTGQLLFTWTFGDGSTQVSSYGMTAPQHNYTAAGTYTINLQVFDGNSTSTDSTTITVTNRNNPGVNDGPTANAGPDMTYTLNATNQTIVTFDGTGSTDPDNTTDQLTFTWSNGLVGMINSTIYTQPGVYTIDLTVFDGQNSSVDQVRITVLPFNSTSNDGPVADAGPDQNTGLNASGQILIQLDGSGSYDPDGDQLTYVWTNPSLPTMYGEQPTVVINTTGTFAITLVVNDSELSDSDTVYISINDSSVIDSCSNLVNATIINSTIANCSTKINVVMINSKNNNCDVYDSNETNVSCDDSTVTNSSLLKDLNITDGNLNNTCLYQGAIFYRGVNPNPISGNSTYTGTYYYSDFNTTYVYCLDFIYDIQPSAPAVNITPINPPVAPYTIDDLTCSFERNATDLDNATQNISYFFYWLRNGTRMFMEHKNSTSSVLKSGNTTKHDLWNCTATSFDGLKYGVYNVSATTLIYNRFPTLQMIILTPNKGSFNTTVTVTTINAADADNDTLLLKCGDSPGKYNFCNETNGSSVYGYPERNCTFSTPWFDNSVHQVYCVVEDPEGLRSIERNNQFTADVTPPAPGTIYSIEDDTDPKYWDTDDDNHTIIQVNYEEELIKCRYSATHQVFDDILATNNCTIVGSVSTCDVWNVVPYQINETSVYIACEDRYGNDQNLSGVLNATYGSDFTMPSVTSSNGIGHHAPGYNVTLTIHDLNGSTLVTVSWCKDVVDNCTPNQIFSGYNGTTINITFTEPRGTWYLRWNASDEVGHNLPNNTMTARVFINILPALTNYTPTNLTHHYVRFNISAKDNDTDDMNCTLVHTKDGINYNFTQMTLVSGLLSNGTWEANISEADGYTQDDNLTAYVNCTDGIATIYYVGLESNFSENITFMLPNYAPEFNLSNLIANLTWAEDTIESSLNLLPHFFDIDEDDINFSFTFPENITVIIDNNTGAVTLTPNPNFYGITYILFNATDGRLWSNYSNNVTLNITTVNDDPMLDLSPVTYLPIPEDGYNDSVNLSNYVAEVYGEESDELINWSCFTNNSNTAAYANNVTKILNVSSFNNNTGIFNVTCVAYDTMGGVNVSSFLAFVIELNDPPYIFTALPNVTILEDEFNDTINLSSYVIDVDDPLENLTWNIVWNDTAHVNITILVRDANLTKFMNISAIGNWSGVVYANLTVYDDALFPLTDVYNYMIITFLPVNDEPTNGTLITLTPDPAYTADNLYCNISGEYDVDNDSTNHYFEWYKNGTLNMTFYTSENFSMLVLANTSKYDVWNCTITANDGLLNSTNKMSAAIYINNTPPRAANSLDPIAFHNKTSSITWNHGADDDNYTLSPYNWDTVTSWLCVATNNTNRDSNVCDVHSYTIHDISNYTFAPNEIDYWYNQTITNYFIRIIGTDENESNGTIYDTEFNLTNTRPVPTLNITPWTPTTIDTLFCNYTFIDADNDSENVSAVQFLWYRRIAGQSQYNLVAGQTNQTYFDFGFNNNDSAICSVFVEDEFGLEAIAWVNSSAITIFGHYPYFVAPPYIGFDEDTFNYTNLSMYVRDIDHNWSEINWSFGGDWSNLTIVLDNVTKFANISAQPNWCGERNVSFSPIDPDFLSTTNWTFINVTCVNEVPNVRDITLSQTRARLGTNITITTVDADDIDLAFGDNVSLRCGTADFTWNLCNSTYGQPERNCTFASPWADNSIHDVFCRLYDLSNAYNDSLLNPDLQIDQVTADNIPPVTLRIDTLYSDTQPKYWDTLGIFDTIVWITLNETDITCRWDYNDTDYYSMNASNGCTTTGGSSSVNCFMHSPVESNETVRHISCIDSVGNTQNTSQNINVTYGVDYTTPWVTTSNDGNTHPPPYIISLTIHDAPNESVVNVSWCTSQQQNNCTQWINFSGINNTVYTLPWYNTEGVWYLFWNATDEAGHINSTKNTTIYIGNRTITVSQPVFIDRPGHKFSVRAEGQSVNPNPLNCVIYHQNTTAALYNLTNMTLVSGNLTSGTWEGNISIADNYSVFQQVNLYVNCSDMNYSSQDNLSSHNIPNLVPVNASLFMLPTSPYTSDNILCNVTPQAVDEDNDTVGYYFLWYKNGALTVESGLLFLNYNILLEPNTTKGESWNCTAIPTDGYQNSTAVSAAVLINNTPPVINSMLLDPQYPKDYHNLTCNVTSASDIDPVDNNSLNYTFLWYMNGTLMRTVLYSIYNNDTVRAGNTTEGDIWNCTIIPFDGVINGSAISASALVGNSPPFANAGPDQNLAFNPLGVNVEFNGTNSSDPEGDDLTFLWDNGLNGSLVNLTYFTPGTYIVTLTVADNFLSDTDTVTITIGDNSSLDNISSLVNTTVINSTIINSTKVECIINQSYVMKSTNFYSNITNSEENYSTINYSTVIDSTVINSTKIDCIINDSDILLSVNYHTNLTDSQENYSKINYSTLINSNISNSTILNSTLVDTYSSLSNITNSSIENSTIENSDLFNFTSINCTIINSTIWNSYCKDSTVINSSGSGWSIDPSLVTNSVCTGTCIISNSKVDLASITNSNITFSNVSNATVHGIVTSSVKYANLTNEQIVEGNVTFKGHTYSVNNTVAPAVQALPKPWSLNNTYAECGNGVCAGLNVCGNDNVYPTCNFDCDVCPVAGPMAMSGGGGGGGTQCVDGKDNDKDGLVDWPNDPGCATRLDNDERDAKVCIVDWACTLWSKCTRDKIQTRQCWDDNNCEMELEKGRVDEIVSSIPPKEEQACVGCILDSDCQAGYECVDDFCEVITERCGDGVQNYGETGTDCGGPCEPCLEIPISLRVPESLSIVRSAISEIKPVVPAAAERMDLWAKYMENKYWFISKYVSASVNHKIENSLEPYWRYAVGKTELGVALTQTLARHVHEQATDVYVPAARRIALTLARYTEDTAIALKYFYRGAMASISIDLGEASSNFRSFFTEDYVPGVEKIIVKFGETMAYVGQEISGVAKQMAGVIGQDLYNNMLEGWKIAYETGKQVEYTVTYSYIPFVKESLKPITEPISQYFENNKEQAQFGAVVLSVMLGLLLGGALISKGLRNSSSFKNYKQKKIDEKKQKIKQIKREIHNEIRLTKQEEVDEFILKSFSSGMTKQDIKKSLAAMGWPNNFIDRYVDSFFRIHAKSLKAIAMQHHVDRSGRLAFQEKRIDEEINKTPEHIAQLYKKYEKEPAGKKQEHELKLDPKQQKESAKMKKELEDMLKHVNKNLSELKK